MDKNPPILSLKGITKRFPGVVALSDVSLDLNSGCVHALVGENGAGKSTLMKVLAGVYQPDEGHVFLSNLPVKFPNPKSAIENGVLLIHQELSLSPELSVAENIYLGIWPTNALGVVKKNILNQEAQTALDLLGCDFKSTDLVKDLSIAKQQMVEIARVYAYNAKIIVFDEPTASLTDTEKDKLFSTIRKLKEQGAAVVYISHKMDEIFDITDLITVLKDGVLQATLPTESTNAQEITTKMIGRNIDKYFIRANSAFGDPVLKVQGLSKKGQFSNINFSVRSGEVLGLYGLVGAGRSEIVETLFGLRKSDSGVITFDDKVVQFSSAREAVDAGMALVPENRKEQGLVLGMGGRSNISLPNLKSVSSLGVLNQPKESLLFVKYKDLLEIKTTGPNQAVANLSGGNQQKFVLAKWLSTNPKLIILDEPTRGIDVGSKSAIHELIASLAEQGMAVIVISSEMPEVIGVSHRILVLSDGHIVKELTGDSMTEKNLINAVSF
ncbi:fused D-ribose transporter subunits of ABC superfamily: ATP-binding components [Vibrio nigripulchritudo SOn1]|uniref:Fused D-ribose transporter subunits of ABC superfamily: ATP-binding components n=1 Tax=Vibrio nigripulchritudo SOn1 TaxID=1238450 RepID=A0AAV2VU05_9VIBR|nr:sugar ABC transporter ATP-binding protein [Vibrio nigripulchritudo]CCO47868.1 fused D-ribose transporter subunits of ABC superfamily: ATP-binding components [Vibrio nigripulchritudo SOn1]